jgi:hypothetical protein
VAFLVEREKWLVRFVKRESWGRGCVCVEVGFGGGLEGVREWEWGSF